MCKFLLSFYFILLTCKINPLVANWYGDWSIGHSQAYCGYPINEDYGDKNRDALQSEEKVELKVYYESLCGYSKKFLINEVQPLVELLGQNVELYLYPYGNVRVTYSDGSFTMKCQHGPEECYGNKLHACALQVLGSVVGLKFVSCLMSYPKGSDDQTVTFCQDTLFIPADSIKQCAMSCEGDKLHLFNGIETAKVNQKYVPYVLINGVHHEFDPVPGNFKKAVCATFKDPVQACSL